MTPIILLSIVSSLINPKINEVPPVTSVVAPIVTSVTTIRYDVPLYSQITDITSPEWKQKGCGVADLAMLIEYYKPKTTTVQKVLETALVFGAYQKNVGWSHEGLANLAKKYDLVGKTIDYTKLNKDTALSQLKDIIKEGPAIASIHRGFNPKSSFGHLIVITGFDNDLIYYNDPGKHDGIRKVTITDFLKGWKQRLIVVRLPVSEKQIALVY